MLHASLAWTDPCRPPIATGECEIKAPAPGWSFPCTCKLPITPSPRLQCWFVSDMCRDPILVSRGLLFRTTRDADSKDKSMWKRFGLPAYRCQQPTLNIEGGGAGGFIFALTGRSHRSLHVCRILISIHPRLCRIRMSMHPRLCRIRMSMHPRLCRIRMSMRPRLQYSHVDASSVCRCILGVPARAMPAQPLQRKPKIWRAGADAGAAAFITHACILRSMAFGAVTLRAHISAQHAPR